MIYSLTIIATWCIEITCYCNINSFILIDNYNYWTLGRIALTANQFINRTI